MPGCKPIHGLWVSSLCDCGSGIRLDDRSDIKIHCGLGPAASTWLGPLWHN